MIAMQRVQPEIKKLQAKYKGDRQKLNEEMMKLYQENKINPLAGCLPLVLQLPIFFALFRVLRDSYKYVPLDSNLFADLCRKSNGVVSKTADACGKGTGVNHLKFLGIDLSKAATDSHSSAWVALPVLRPRRPRGAHRVPAVPPGPEAHAGGQQADGDHHEGAPGVLRVHLAAVPRRPGALLLREQPVAPRSARGHLPAVPGRRDRWRQTRGRVGQLGREGVDRDRGHRRRQQGSKQRGRRRGRRRRARAAQAAPAGAHGAHPTARPAPRPERKPAPAPAARQEPRGGGLRRLFQPPPPAEGNGNTTGPGKPAAPRPSPAKGGGTGRPSGGSTSAGRPGQAGRRTSNKKRKRKR